MTKTGHFTGLTSYSMSLFISFNIEGEQQISRRIQGLANKDLGAAFARIGRKLVDFYSGAVFDTEGAVIGQRWVGGPSYHGLVRTGEMRSSFDFIAQSDRLTIFNTSDHFKYHQSNRPRTKLPRRVMIKLDNPRKELVVKEIQKEYVDELQSRI